MNDHSSDNSINIIRHYPDSRINCIDNPGHGLIEALNHGIKACQYDYIARMDSDDLMRTNRLSEQLAHFQSTPDLQLSASQVSLFCNEPLKAGYLAYIAWQNNVLSDLEIKNQIFVESPLAHPSVMFRKTTIVNLGGYREGDFPEDYDLWLRLFSKGCRMEKLPLTLLDWREAPIRESRVNPRYRREAFDQLRAKYLSQDCRLPNNRPINIWGAGRKTRLRAKWLIKTGINLTAWIDIDPKKIGNTINGIEVKSPNWLIESTSKPFVLIYVTNHGAREDISAYLDSIGYHCGKDYLAVG